MKCTDPKCKGKLGITHTYTVGSARYARAVCNVCKRVHSAQTLAVPVRRGDGAKSRAHRAIKGTSQ